MDRNRKTKQTGPLTDQHLKVLNRLLDSCAETLAYCKVCEACNLDVSPEVKKTEEQMEIAKRIKARFFPTAK